MPRTNAEANQKFNEKTSQRADDECISFRIWLKELQVTDVKNAQILGVDRLSYLDWKEIYGAGSFGRLVENYIGSFLKSSPSDTAVLIYLHPVTLSNGSLYLLKTMASIAQRDENGDVSQLYFHSTIVKKSFDFEPLHPRLQNGDLIEKKMFLELRRNFYQSKANPFSPKEMMLLECYQSPKCEPAQKLGIEQSTVHFYNKKILEKARQYFDLEHAFKSAQEVSAFLSKSGLLFEN